MKVASFCNVDLECVVQSEDMPSIYEVPVSMQQQGLDAAILRKIGIPVGETPAMKPWHDFLDKQRKATREVQIALVGKYDLQDAYKSIRESLNLAGIYNDVKARLHFVNSEELTTDNVATQLKDMQGVVICPGFGSRGIEGKIIAAEYTRTHDIPTFGICLGMQMMVIEFARNVLGYKDANSAEMRPTPQPLPVMEGSGYHEAPVNVIDLMEEQKNITQMGGTMRLGAYDCKVLKGSKSFDAYSQSELSTPLHNREGQGEGLLTKERHRHRYEFNNAYKEAYEQAGMQCVGINPDADLVEIVEIPTLQWYIVTQFHPEYSSTVLHPHPLFQSFVKTCINQQ
jgi:CTP synthase